MRTLISTDPYSHLHEAKNWISRGVWPCRWVACPGLTEPGRTPFVTAYRRRFQLDAAATIHAHVSADERYELYLDGLRLGRGPERGSPDRWFYETYDLSISRGRHVLVARVWSLGSQAPCAQLSLVPGFLFSPQKERFIKLLGTGVAAWEAKPLPGYTWHDPAPAGFSGAKITVDGAAFPWGFERGEDGCEIGEPGARKEPSPQPSPSEGRGGWEPVVIGHEAIDGCLRNESAGPAAFPGYPGVHRLFPGALPPMLDRPRPPGQVRFVSVGPPSFTKPFHVFGKPATFSAEDAAAARVDSADDLPGEHAAWDALLLRQQPVAVPPGSIRRVLIDLDDYTCAYPELVVSGGQGGSVRIAWAESLYDALEPLSPRERVPPSAAAGEGTPGCAPAPSPGLLPKGDRNAITGKFFLGVGDTFLPDGGENRRFDTLWWQAGRYVELFVQTRDQPLTIRGLTLRETRYPLEMETSFACSNPRVEQVIPRGLRALQMCSHETYMDCPYYEQLMYAGDTRLEALTTYCLTRDDRLPRKALMAFDASRLTTGLTQSRFPSRVRQVIPPFSLWWIGMVRDFALWRDDPAFVRTLMPGGRGVIDAFLACRDGDGLIRGPNGWNFVDWVTSPGWDDGIPPDGDKGVNGSINWQFILSLTYLRELESYVGEPELAARAERLAREATAAALKGFFDPARGLLAENLSHTSFSEHTQCLALLSGQLPPDAAARIAQGLLLSSSPSGRGCPDPVGGSGQVRASSPRRAAPRPAPPPDLARTTIYFAHYLFETYRLLGRVDAIIERMGLWFDAEKLGVKTTLEMNEPSRSDCHAWGAHPLYHYFATILGLRPGDFGFRRVRVAPNLGLLKWARGRLVHPSGGGWVEADFRADGSHLRGMVMLPDGVHGSLIANGAERKLQPGPNVVG